MIWAEIPVDSDSKDIPKDWRTADEDRSRRWYKQPDQKQGMYDGHIDVSNEQMEEDDADVEDLMEDMLVKDVKRRERRKRKNIKKNVKKEVEDEIPGLQKHEDPVEERDIMDEFLESIQNSQLPELQTYEDEPMSQTIQKTRDKVSNQIPEEDEEEVEPMPGYGPSFEPIDVEEDICPGCVTQSDTEDEDDDCMKIEDYDEEEDEDDVTDMEIVDPYDEGIEKIDKDETPGNWENKPLWERTLSELVVGLMPHNPCGKHCKNGHKRFCQKNGQCQGKFPKPKVNTSDCTNDGYAQYRRRDYLNPEDEETKMPTKRKYVEGVKMKKDEKSQGFKHEFTNEWLPGYNPSLLMKY